MKAPDVMIMAGPDDIQWSIVIFMMALGIWITALKAGKFLNISSLNCIFKKSSGPILNLIAPSYVVELLPKSLPLIWIRNLSLISSPTVSVKLASPFVPVFNIIYGFLFNGIGSHPFLLSQYTGLAMRQSTILTTRMRIECINVFLYMACFAFHADNIV